MHSRDIPDLNVSVAELLSTVSTITLVVIAGRVVIAGVLSGVCVAERVEVGVTEQVYRVGSTEAVIKERRSLTTQLFAEVAFVKSEVSATVDTG
ncbi:uncharacterized protein BDZ99DRAFT_527878 [Mytilinidion resinicola]|uniref:Uncharacterized protein n=1 Tax=Mytilinidion resinicola TaxID=574789 RepID=A0A6A6Y112_9PEZI|nr:uncharacterized protein BDZ99DRAFT_527878 [Mytilinidion resinicola]KAF2801915.1 hypothetical protein BDZ99DRAFT_527878 [Mytilinidion resinicola]